MGLFYCIIAVLLGFLFTKVYTAPNMKTRAVVLILFPILLNLCISLLVALFVDNSLGYGYNAGSIAGTLFPATLVMMIVLGFRIVLKKTMMENQHVDSNDLEKIKNTADNKKACSSSISSTGWFRAMLVLTLIIISFLFALNGRYSYLVDGVILDKWSGKAFYIDKILDE